MDAELLFAKIHRKLVYQIAPRLVPLQVRALQRANETSNEQLLSETGPVVSLTTHGPRIETVHLTIESLGRGRQKPSRLILWLDDAGRFRDLPEGLRRLQRRGMEVLLTDNFGPHTKYYPYVASLAKHSVPLVTADDDVIYPRWWLQRLCAAHAAWPDEICCYRAHVVALSDKDGEPSILPYRSWPPCRSREPKRRHFATGVSGVIYPPRFLDFLHAQRNGFVHCCPKNDDIWLHAMALHAGLCVRQLGRLPRYFEGLPGTQDQGLVHSNSFGGGNDKQAAATYLAPAIRKMVDEGS